MRRYCGCVSWRFRSPPGWPIRDPEWLPPPGWAPEPDWPPAPPGWTFWTQVPQIEQHVPQPDQQPEQQIPQPERLGQAPWTPQTMQSAQTTRPTSSGQSGVGFPAPSPDPGSGPVPWRIGSRGVVAVLVTLTVLAGIVVVPQVVSWWNGRLPEGTEELFSTDHGSISAIGVTQVAGEPVAVLQEYPATDLFVLNLETGARRTLPQSWVSAIAVTELAGAPVALTVVSEDDLVRAWDLRSGQVVQTLRGHTARINGIVAGHVNGVDVAITTSGGELPSAQLWDLETGDLLHRVSGRVDDHGVKNALALSEVDGEPVVVIGRSGGLLVYRITPELRLVHHHTLTCPDNSPLGWNPPAGGVATGELAGRPVVVGGCRSAAVWDLLTGNLIRTLDEDLGDPYATVIVEHGGTTVAMVGTFADPMLCWDLISDEVTCEIDLTARWLTVTELDGRPTVAATDLEGRLLTWPLDPTG